MDGDCQRLTFLTPEPPPLRPFQMKKPAMVARRHSDCFVQQQAAFAAKSVKKSFYNVLAQYNEDWPPLPASSHILPALQGKKPVLLDQQR